MLLHERISEVRSRYLFFNKRMTLNPLFGIQEKLWLLFLPRVAFHKWPAPRGDISQLEPVFAHSSQIVGGPFAVLSAFPFTSAQEVGPCPGVSVRRDS